MQNHNIYSTLTILCNQLAEPPVELSKILLEFFTSKHRSFFSGRH